MIEIAALLGAFEQIRTVDIWVTGVHRTSSNDVLIEFIARKLGRTFCAEMPLPHVEDSSIWMYSEPDDAEEAASMMATFLDEEAATHALLSAHVSRNGCLELAPYGFRQENPLEHARLMRGDSSSVRGREEPGSPFPGSTSTS